MARQLIEETEVNMVFREQEEEEAEIGERVTRNKAEVEVHTDHPVITIVFIAMRKAIAKPIVLNISRRRLIRTHVFSVGSQAIG